MARDINQILAEVTAQSDPQRKTVLNQISQLPQQQAAQESALAARKDQAYEEILGGARRRGLGFSGIPLGEQAKYAATEYAPAVANLKSSMNDRQSTLEAALASIGSNNYATAQDIFNADRTFAEQQRQFNENLAFQRQQAAQQAAASAGSNNALSSLFGGGTGVAGASTAKPVPIDANKQNLYNQVKNMLGRMGKDQQSVLREINAIHPRAVYGNKNDLYKLQVLYSLSPSLFEGRKSALKLIGAK